MTATYTFDVFATLDGYGSYHEPGDWGGYWGKQGPELLEHRLELYSSDNRIVYGAETMRVNVAMLGPNTEGAVEPDPWVERMRAMPTTVVSRTLEEPLDWPNVTIERGDAAEILARLKDESDVPLRSHGSLSLNRSLMAAGLVDRIQITIFPVISGQTGADRIFAGAADFDLELLDTQTFDERIQELTYRPSLHH